MVPKSTYLCHKRFIYVSPEEMQQLNLSRVQHPDVDSRDTDDMVALAGMLDHRSQLI